MILLEKLPKTIRNPRNTDWIKFRNELGDKLNYYTGFRVESRDDLEVVAAMPDISIRDSFASSCTGKIIQDKSMWWTKELDKLWKRYMSPTPQNGFRERKVYHNFVLILYTESQILYTIPYCAIGNSNLGGW